MGLVSKQQDLPKAATKRTVSIEGLFTGAKLHRSPKPASHTLTTLTNDGLFFHSREQKHPAYLRILHATDQYRAGARARQVDQVDIAYDELISRLNAFNPEGQRLQTAGIPTQQSLNQLKAKTETHFKPLAEDTMRIRMSDGSIETINLGRSMVTYQKRVQEKTAQVKTLLQQLDQIDAEIGVARDAIANDLDDAIKEANTKRDTRLTEIKQDVANAKESFLAEIAAAQKSEAENTKKFHGRLKGLMEDVTQT